MAMTLAEALAKETNITTTDNGAVARKTTESSLLDFFSVCGAMRNSSVDDIINIFGKAYADDALNALRILFYTRDVRGGVGERKTFRTILNYLGNAHPEAVVANMDLIGGIYGRFDDLYALINTKAEKDMWEYMRAIYDADMENMENGEPISLWAKWVANPNNKLPKTKELGRKTAKGIGFGKQGYTTYCKNLSKMRKYLDLPEIKIAAKDYANIDYSKVASKCLMKYRGAFQKHDSERYTKFLEAVEKGEKKINTSTVVPYDILHNVRKYTNVRQYVQGDMRQLELTWKNLPNYLSNTEKNVLVMCDTSGSMTIDGGRPMEVAVSLSMYFAERNHGPYHNKFITFSHVPSYVDIEGDNLYSKYKNIMKADWGNDTNIEAAFDLILNTAIKYDLGQKDIPNALLIVSDMQFNPFWCLSGEDFQMAMSRKFREHGYTLPNVIFWNVRASNPVFHSTKNKVGVQLVSGENPAIFQQVMQALDMTAYDAMMKVLTSERYKPVTLG